MKNTFSLLLIFCLGFSTLSAQWTPVKSLTGAMTPTVKSEGQYVVVLPVYRNGLYYSSDFGSSWQFYPHYVTDATIWHNNLIYVDSAQNINIDYGFTNTTICLSSFFKNNRVRAGNVQYANGRFFCAAFIDSNFTSQVYYSDDTCTTWHLIPQIKYGGAYKATGHFVYGFNYSGYILCSADAGMTWDSTYITNAPTALDARDSIIAYGLSAVSYSTNGGHIWQHSARNLSPGVETITIGDSAIYYSGDGYARGLYRIDHSGVDQVLSAPVLIDSSISSTCYNNGKILIGTSSEGLFYFNERTKHIDTFATQVYMQYVLHKYIDGKNIVTSNTWSFINGAIQRHQIRYSCDYGHTFRYVSTKYSPMYTPIVIDSSVYFFCQPGGSGSRMNFYKITGGQEQIISGDSTINPQILKKIDGTLFLLSRINYPNAVLQRSDDTGATWHVCDTMNYINDMVVYGDTLFIQVQTQIRVYDKRGAKAYTIFGSVGSSFDHLHISVDDSSIVVNSDNYLLKISRRTHLTTLNLSPSNFNAGSFFSSTVYKGYIFAGTDSAGTFILPPDSSHWIPFNQGLYPLSVWSYDFTDSMIYITASSDQWLWHRKISDLTHPDSIDVVNNIADIIEDGKMILYPNPADASITIATPGITHSQIRIFDALGHLIISNATREEMTILELGFLPEGDYIAEVQTTSKRESRAFVIRHK